MHYIVLKTLYLVILYGKIIIWFIFQSAPVLDIDSTLSKEINKYTNNVIPYVVIRGLVKPLGTPIKSNYNQAVTGVIQR